MTTYALYCPEQHLDDYLHDPEMWRPALLEACAWTSSGPVVTVEQFASFIATWGADDRNGNWGQIVAVMSADAGRVMVWMSADAWIRCDEETWPRDGMTVAELWDIDSEVAVWEPGDGGVYRLADVDGWDDWMEVDA